MSSLYGLPGRRWRSRPMPTLRAERTIAADPLGLALLMAGPAARSLWPAAAPVQRYSPARHVRRRDGVDGGPRAAVVEVGSSVRSGSELLLPLTIAVGGRPPLSGALRLTPIGAVYDAPATRAALTLEHDGQPPRRLRRLVEQYLANLAAAAEKRIQAP